MHATHADLPTAPQPPTAPQAEAVPVLSEQQIAHLFPTTTNDKAARSAAALLDGRRADIAARHASAIGAAFASGGAGDAGAADMMLHEVENRLAEIFNPSANTAIARHARQGGHAVPPALPGRHLAEYAQLALLIVRALAQQRFVSRMRLADMLECILSRLFVQMIQSNPASARDTGPAMEQMSQADLLGKVQSVASATKNLNAVTCDISRLDRGSAVLDANTLAISTSVDNLLQGIGKINLDSEEAASGASATERDLEKGLTSMQAVSDTVLAIAQTSEVTAGSLSELQAASGQITEFLSVIENIANQTNLLALNATIEAARAGDSGKGFAVVASEVKNLANQAARATEDIADRIDALNAGMETIHSSISGSRDAVKKSQDAIETANAQMRTVGSKISEVARKMQDIYDVLQQQKQSGEEIASVTAKIDSLAVETRQILVKANQCMKESGEDLLAPVHSCIDDNSNLSLCARATIEHFILHTRMRAALTAEKPVRLSDFPELTTSAFRRWYEGPHPPEVLDDRAFIAMRAPFEEFAEVFRRAVAAKSGDSEKLYDEMDGLAQSSMKFISAISTLSDAFATRLRELERRQSYPMAGDEKPARTGGDESPGDKLPSSAKARAGAAHPQLGIAS